jgi:hypothetical protein
VGRSEKLAIAAAVVAIFAALVVTAGLRLLVHGVSARDEPTAVEAWAARTMRRLATPAKARNMTNPVPASELESLA